MSYHIRLIKALSYRGAVSATREHPDVFVEDPATAENAVATGYFVPVADEESGTPEPSETEYGGKPLAEMNKSELETFAAYRDVSLKGAKTKAEMVEKLRAALPASDLEGDIWYGSPTMQELQA